MKKILYFIVATAIIATGASCSSSKASKGKPISKGEVEIAIPLSGPDYSSNKHYWRSVQMGTSTEVSMAKKVALQNARQDLAATVQAQIKAVLENYGQNANVDNRAQSENLYQELTRTVVNQTLVGADIAGEKLFQTEDGNYRYHICLQMSKDAVANEMIKQLSEDEIMKLEFDRERFKKVYDEELEKFTKGRLEFNL